MPAVGDSVHLIWDLAAKAGGPWNGLSGTMTTTLRRTDGATVSAASESVTIAEPSSGLYILTVVSLQEAETYNLHVVESTTGFEVEFEIIVSASATVGDLTYSYATVSDVEAIAQLGAYSSGTKPTEAQVQFFLVNRSAELYGRMVKTGGNLTPGPSGYAITIDTTNDVGYALDRAARHAAATRAAVDALQAAVAGETPARSERIAELEALYNTQLEDIDDLVLAYVDEGARVRSHITAGEASRASITTRQEPGFSFEADEKY